MEEWKRLAGRVKERNLPASTGMMRKRQRRKYGAKNRILRHEKEEQLLIYKRLFAGVM